MKNYKFFAIPIVLATVFSCNTEQLSLYGPGEVIRFDAGTSLQQSKAATDFPQDSDFGVSAFHTKGSASYQYFGNVRVAYSSSAWNTAQTLYWPKAASGDGTLLEFRGYAPYNSTPWCTFPDNATLSGEYSLTPADSPDLMYSTPKAMSPANPNTVSLTFNHALGQTTYTFMVDRFDDSVEMGTYSTAYGDYNIYCKYTENDSSRPIEEKSFVFLSGNFPQSFDGVSTYEPSTQAFDLKNPIQNIWYVEVSGIEVHNLAWTGELVMTTDGSTWTKPDNSAWTSLSDRQTLTLLPEENPFYFSPNTKGFAMPLGTYSVIPQDLSPVISSQKPHISIKVRISLFRAEDNAANDSETPGDVRSKIFDYRDIAQYITDGGDKVDGDVKKAGVFKEWYHTDLQRVFPDGTVLDSGVAVPRKDAKPLYTITKAVDLPLYDAAKPVNPRYLKMNTNTTYSIKIDPAGEEITFTPSVDVWMSQSVQDK